MTMLQMGHSFTFTDCHHAVLNFLVANAKINFDKVTIMVIKQNNVLDILRIRIMCIIIFEIASFTQASLRNRVVFRMVK